MSKLSETAVKKISEICDYLPKSNLKAGLGSKEGTYCGS